MTLVELNVVTAIVGILASLAFPSLATGPLMVLDKLGLLPGTGLPFLGFAVTFISLDIFPASAPFMSLQFALGGNAKSLPEGGARLALTFIAGFGLRVVDLVPGVHRNQMRPAVIFGERATVGSPWRFRLKMNVAVPVLLAVFLPRLLINLGSWESWLFSNGAVNAIFTFYPVNEIQFEGPVRPVHSIYAEFAWDFAHLNIPGLPPSPSDFSDEVLERLRGAAGGMCEGNPTCTPADLVDLE